MHLFQHPGGERFAVRHTGNIFTPIEDDILIGLMTTEAGVKIGIVHRNIVDGMALCVED
jgi:hypothetical protein